MPLGVTVRLSVLAGESTKLRVQVEDPDTSGTIEIPWETAFQGQPHTVVMLQPSGGGFKLSHKTIKKRSAIQERKRIEAVGGQRHKGSGSMAGYKSDGSVGYRWRMENKFTTAASYRVTFSDLQKIRGECINGQQPVFNIDFQEERTGATKDSWVLIPTKEWERLVHAADNKRPASSST